MIHFRFIFLFIFPLSIFGLDNTFIESLITQSKTQKIAEKKEWKNLLHIDKTQSEIISPYFFLTPLPSKHLAQDELEATIRAFYQPPSQVVVPEAIKKRRLKQITNFKEHNIALPTRSIHPDDYHALCRFPARFALLSQYLNFESLPEVDCAEFKAMRDYISPTKASIIFPTAHINSPASMFGHTFLLLDSHFQSRLLAFALNYQADANPNDENAISFALKGLFGFYTGSYSILPYYDKIKEYTNTESRDIWEYGLNLTQEEITQLYNHVWELSDAYSYYYFFNKNCSYNILWLLEVARPSLNLRAQFIYQVNPPETLFVLQKAGLLTDITYRPSKRTKLLSYEKVMSQKDIKLSRALSLGKMKATDVLNNTAPTHENTAYILESALDLSEYYFLKGKLKKDQYTQIAHDLALNRSKLGASNPPFIPTPANPLEGNQALRVTPLALFNEDGAHIGLDFRIAYHDITDNDKGYLKGAQIEFMRALAYYNTSKALKNGALSLHELNILSVASIAPLSKFFKPFSYRLETGLNRTFDDLYLHYFIAFGGGLSLNLFDYGYMYYLLEPTFFVNANKRADFLLSNVLGLVIYDNKSLKATLEYKLKAYSPTHFSHIADMTLSYNLRQNLALFARMQSIKNDIRAQNISMLGLRLYF